MSTWVLSLAYSLLLLAVQDESVGWEGRSHWTWFVGRARSGFRRSSAIKWTPFGDQFYVADEPSDQIRVEE